MKIAVWNILDMVEEYGEDSVKEILSVFSCKREKDGEAVSLNPDIEHFIKNNLTQDNRPGIIQRIYTPSNDKCSGFAGLLE